MLLFVICTKGKHSRDHDIDDAGCLPIVDITLAHRRLFDVLVVLQHLDLLVSVSLLRAVVNVISLKELSDNQRVHPTKQTPKNNESGTHLCEEL